MGAPSQQMPEILQKALKTARLRHVPRGQIILYEGDTPQDVYIVKSGIVKLYDIDEQGNEKVLHIVKTPALVPFTFFSGMRDPLRWFYETLTDCDFYIVPAKEFMELTRTDGALLAAVTNTFSNDVHELLTRLSSLGKTNAQDKVVAVLKFLVACHSTERRSSWWRVEFPISHQLIANICGITRESTTLVMKELQAQKIIRRPRINVLDIHKPSLITL